MGCGQSSAVSPLPQETYRSEEANAISTSTQVPPTAKQEYEIVLEVNSKDLHEEFYQQEERGQLEKDIDDADKSSLSGSHNGRLIFVEAAEHRESFSNVGHSDANNSVISSPKADSHSVESPGKSGADSQNFVQDKEDDLHANGKEISDKDENTVCKNDSESDSNTYGYALEKEDIRFSPNIQHSPNHKNNKRTSVPEVIVEKDGEHFQFVQPTIESGNNDAHRDSALCLETSVSGQDDVSLNSTLSSKNDLIQGPSSKRTLQFLESLQVEEFNSKSSVKQSAKCSTKNDQKGKSKLNSHRKQSADKLTIEIQDLNKGLPKVQHSPKSRSQSSDSVSPSNKHGKKKKEPKMEGKKTSRRRKKVGVGRDDNLQLPREVENSKRYWCQRASTCSSVYSVSSTVNESESDDAHSSNSSYRRESFTVINDVQKNVEFLDPGLILFSKGNEIIDPFMRQTFSDDTSAEFPSTGAVLSNVAEADENLISECCPADVLDDKRKNENNHLNTQENSITNICKDTTDQSISTFYKACECSTLQEDATLESNRSLLPVTERPRLDWTEPDCSSILYNPLVVISKDDCTNSNLVESESIKTQQHLDVNLIKEISETCEMPNRPTCNSSEEVPILIASHHNYVTTSETPGSLTASEPQARGQSSGVETTETQVGVPTTDIEPSETQVGVATADIGLSETQGGVPTSDIVPFNIQRGVLTTDIGPSESQGAVPTSEIKPSKTQVGVATTDIGPSEIQGGIPISEIGLCKTQVSLETSGTKNSLTEVEI